MHKHTAPLLGLCICKQYFNFLRKTLKNQQKSGKIKKISREGMWDR